MLPDILGLGERPKHLGRRAHDAMLVPHHQLLEGREISRLGPAHERNVIVLLFAGAGGRTVLVKGHGASECEIHP